MDMLLQADATSAAGTPKKAKKKSSKKDGAGDSCALLLHFWLTVVDELLFNSDSANRKYLAFQLVSAIVGRLTAEQITLVFTPNFLRCLITHLSDRSTQLHAAAKATVRTFHPIVPKIGTALTSAAAFYCEGCRRERGAPYAHRAAAPFH